MTFESFIKDFKAKQSISKLLKIAHSLRIETRMTYIERANRICHYCTRGKVED